MSCPHCYAEPFRDVEPVALGDLKRALDEAWELGVFHWVLQGGEPIQDTERLEAIIGMAHPDESYINVISNGWGMTVEKIRWLKELKVDKIAFSMDSGLEAEHDANRMPGSYQKVLGAIENVLTEGLLTSISTVVTHQSLYSEGFRRAYEYAKEKGIRIDVQIAEPVGKWDGRKDILMTTADSRYVKELQMNCPILQNGQRMVNRDIFTGDSDHCPAGIEFMALTADGNLLPCNFLQFSLGNIRDKSIKKMRQSLLRSRWFDGKHGSCLCGEDPEFIRRFVIPYINNPKPLDASTIFELNNDPEDERI